MVLGIAGVTALLLVIGEAVPYLRGVVIQIEDNDAHKEEHEEGELEEHEHDEHHGIQNVSFFMYMTCMCVSYYLLHVHDCIK